MAYLYLVIALLFICVLYQKGAVDLAIMLISVLAIAGYTVEAIKKVLVIEINVKGVFLNGAKVVTEYKVEEKD